MAQTLTRLLVHVIFSTKDRRNLIVPDVEPRLHAYLGGVCKNEGSPALAIGGIENYVHLLISLSKNVALADLLMNLKKESSKWIKTVGREFFGFHWQDGYGGFSIGQSQVRSTIAYIQNQKQRHKTMTFEEELIKLAERYEVAFDPRFLWS